MADNPLFQCRRSWTDAWELRFRVGDLPVFNLQSSPNWIGDGLLCCDTLRDISLQGTALLVATGTGVWQYDFNRGEEVAVPTDAVYFASFPDGKPMPMLDLKQFVRVYPADSQAGDAELWVTTRQGPTQYLRHDQEWSVETTQPLTNSRRRFGNIQIESGSGPLTIREGEAVRAQPGDEFPLLEGTFESSASIWLPLRSRLLRVRKGW